MNTARLFWSVVFTCFIGIVLVTTILFDKNELEVQPQDPNESLHKLDYCSVPYEWFNSHPSFTFKQVDGICYWFDYQENIWRIIQ